MAAGHRPPGGPGTKRGRPTIRTDRNRVNVLMALAKGYSRRGACRALGFSEDALADWMRADPDISEAVLKAEAAAEHEMVDIVRNAARRTWQAAAWWLERRLPNLYALRARVDHTVQVQAVAAQLAGELGVDPEAVIAEAESILRAAQRAPGG